MNVLAEYVILLIQIYNQLRMLRCWCQLEANCVMTSGLSEAKQMQLCSGNNYPDCCKHNHLTSAAGLGGRGNIISIGSVRVSGAGGGRLTCVCLRLKNYTWLTGSGDSRGHLRSKMSPILRGAQSSLVVTFLLAGSEIQDNNQRQTVVVQCSPGPHVTCHTCLLCSVKTHKLLQFPGSLSALSPARLTSVKSDQSHILWVKNNNSWAQSSLNSVNNRSEILWENDRAH